MLLNCCGKLFTAILNNRLNNYAEKRKLITSCQAGFPKGFSTVDNLFIIQSLTDILQSQKKKLYCASFVDFKQEFDTVWWTGLWFKVNEFEINGTCFEVIKRIYKTMK